MNILELTKPFSHGGVAEHVTTLSAKLRNKGHKIIVASKEDAHVQTLEERNIKHVKLNFGLINPFAFISCARKLKKLIEQEDIDIVHCHYRACSVYMRFLQKFKGVRIPFVWSNHALKIPSGKIHRKFTFYGERAIAVSERLKTFLRDKLKILSSEISVINNGINPDSFTPPLSDEEKRLAKEKFGISDKTVFLMLGRLNKIKGHDIAIKALKNISQEREDVVLLLTGEGNSRYKRKLQRLIKKEGLTDKVKFLGHVNARDILTASDVMLLPSKSEGCPISVFEAFAMSVPVVRTKTGGYEETAEFCIGTEIGDVDDFTRGIKYVLSNPEEVSKMTKKAQREVFKRWTIDKLAEKVEVLYKDILTEQRKGRREMIGIIHVGNVLKEPYFEKYKNILEENKKEYEIIMWDKCKDGDTSALPDNVYNFDLVDSNRGKIVKFINFMKYSRFVKRILKKRKYDKLIILTTLAAFMCKKELKGKYKGKYVYDFRDLSLERVGWFRKRVARIVKNSAFTCVSSDGFTKYLPSHNYVKAHNFRYSDLSQTKEKINYQKDKLIDLTYIGTSRGYEYNARLIEIFGSDPRFSLKIIGRFCDSPKVLELASLHKNVEVRGRYELSEKHEILSDMDILVNMNIESFNGLQAMANKYYDGIILKKPQLANINTFAGKQIEERGLGISLSFDDEHFADKVYQYWQNLNEEEFNEKAKKELELVLQEDKIYLSKIREFILG